MKLKVGKVPPDPYFNPEREGWRKFHEPNMLVFWIFAIPLSIVMFVATSIAIGAVKDSSAKISFFRRTSRLRQWILLLALAACSCNERGRGGAPEKMNRFLLQSASKLYGSWRSDADATNAYVSENANLNDYQKRVFPTFFGRAVVTYRYDGTGTIEMEATSVPKKDGGELELAATTTDFIFEILGESDSQIAIRRTSDGELFDDNPFAILKFHDTDTYSVSLSDGIAEINGREFFKRVTKTNSEPDGAHQPATRSPSEAK